MSTYSFPPVFCDFSHFRFAVLLSLGRFVAVALVFPRMPPSTVPCAAGVIMS
jgi:hypothetical protein